MRFSVASGTDNALLQTITDSNADIELHTHEIDNNTRPYGIEGLEHIQLAYEGFSIAPHSDTVRASYTVPANKIFRVDLLSIQLIRISTPSSIGHSWGSVSITEFGGASVITFKRSLFTLVEGSDIHEAVSPKIILEAGDYIKLHTADFSTIGNVIYQLYMHGVEVDA